MYRLDNLRYPTSEEGLQALVAGNHIRRLPNDPWGHPYRLCGAGRERAAVHHLDPRARTAAKGGDGENADIGN